MEDNKLDSAPEESDYEDENLTLSIQLRNGEVVETVQVKLDDLEEFLGLNDDKIVLQKVKRRGPRRSAPEELTEP